jgi:hypothetical protein
MLTVNSGPNYAMKLVLYTAWVVVDGRQSLTTSGRTVIMADYDWLISANFQTLPLPKVRRVYVI